jgi:hypothetical protein
MGTWGIKNFENDDAIDWVGELVEQSDKDLVICSLTEIVANEDYLEVPECCEALCAIDIVACVKNDLVSNLPQEVVDWLNKTSDIEFDKDEVELAKVALNRIIDDSELKELIEDSEVYDEWLAYLEEINERL